MWGILKQHLQPFQTAVSMAIRGAGLQGIVWHGLRATAAKWMAEAGCSERENMSITGHTSSAMVGRYVREASQKRQARSAATKVAEYRLKQGIAKPGENGVPNHSKAEAASDPEKA
ncbi:tyrosine-type recombinase/integrase [Komagataeibacter xylinus]|uniref:tyrosine-type recombinase/integrase n=1 Tax=Komagataeibacter xylinus TaxID=28448 RepID=UPI00102F8A2D|nr:tyrosine-type recombinase/integrase [Komagataeibacter xylinus]